MLVVMLAMQLQVSQVPDWERAFKHSYSQLIPWLIVAPFVLWLTARFRLGHGRQGMAHTALHLVVGMVAAGLVEGLFITCFLPNGPGMNGPPDFSPRDEIVHDDQRPPPPNFDEGLLLFGDGLSMGPGPQTPPRPALVVHWMKQLLRQYPTYWIIVAVQSMLLATRDLRQKERQALEIQGKLTQAQLNTLRLQLQPHFLFNTLNATSTLVHSDPEKADQMIGHLSTLLRAVLDEGNANVVPLSRELDLLQAYIDIEQVRFGDRVKFVKDVATDCLHAQVPTLILQPIVENAIRHGIEPRAEGGHVWLTVAKHESQIHITVVDDGIGQMKSENAGWGIGLSNARARLEALYGANGYQVTLSPRGGGGTTVQLAFPFNQPQA